MHAGKIDRMVWVGVGIDVGEIELFYVCFLGEVLNCGRVTVAGLNREVFQLVIEIALVDQEINAPDEMVACFGSAASKLFGRP